MDFFQIIPALSVIECPNLVEAVFTKIECGGSTLTGFTLSIDLEAGEIHYASEAYPFPAWDQQAMLIFQAGGLVEFTKQKLKNRTQGDCSDR